MALPFQLALGNNTPTTVTSGFGRIDLPNPTFLDIHGGAAGQFLATDGNAGLYWATATSSGADAPSDGTAYGRLSGAWARVVAADGGTMTGLLVLSGPPTAALGAATKAYVDAHAFSDAPNDSLTYGRGAVSWKAVLPLAGGTMTGLLTLSGPPANPLHAATKDYVDTHPIDAGTY